MQRAHFDGSSEIGAHAKLTNSYVIVGATHTRQFRQFVESLIDNIPIIETTINSIKTVGRQIQGNKHGLLVPTNTHDHELRILRQELPEAVRVKRIEERLNALGNVILCNDYVAMVHPDVDNESLEIISDVLNVPVYKMCVGENPLVGSYGTMNNQGLLVDPSVTLEQQKALSERLNVQVAAGTVNMGRNVVGGGVTVNDWIGLCGRATSNSELGVMEKIFMLKEEEN